jgi:hypothetical protein
MGLTVVLDQPFQDDSPGRHVDAQRESFRCEHHSHEPLLE